MLPAPFSIEEIKRVPTSVLLEQVFPENKALSKDSGLWTVYEGEAIDDKDEYTQGAIESFSDFIARAIHDMMWKEKQTERATDGIGLDFLIASVHFNPQLKKYGDFDLEKVHAVLAYADKYDISIHLLNEVSVTVMRDNVELCDYGGTFDFAFDSTLEWLEKVNANESQTTNHPSQQEG